MGMIVLVFIDLHICGWITEGVVLSALIRVPTHMSEDSQSCRSW